MIGIIGISFKTASLEIREQFSIPSQEIQLFAEELHKQTNITDIVVLSTCNRTEIYYSQSKYDEATSFKQILNCLVAYKKIDFQADTYFYSFFNDEAVAHLFEVTSGIDSMVIGEDQIIGQVKDAYVTCTELALTDAVLMRLFQKSFEAGKRVRTETAIKTGATSVSYLAVDMCMLEFESLKDQTVFLIGTGDTGALAIQGLYKKGVKNFLVSNRTAENANHIVKKYNAGFVPFSDIALHLHNADIVIVATGAQDYILTKEMIEKSIKERNNNRQIYIDLSVPRNIENFELTIKNAHLISVDDLQIIIDANKEKRAACIEQGTVIIDELTQEFMEWLSFRALQPAIRAINFHLQKIFHDEILQYSQCISDEDQKQIRSFNQQLIQKYSRRIITNLKEVTNNGKKENYLQVINDLFSLKE